VAVAESLLQLQRAVSRFIGKWTQSISGIFLIQLLVDRRSVASEGPLLAVSEDPSRTEPGPDAEGRGSDRRSIRRTARSAEGPRGSGGLAPGAAAGHFPFSRRICTPLAKALLCPLCQTRAFSAVSRAARARYLLPGNRPARRQGPKKIAASPQKSQLFAFRSNDHRNIVIVTIVIDSITTAPGARSTTSCFASESGLAHILWAKNWVPTDE
jgi:hypothetical protein